MSNQEIRDRIIKVCTLLSDGHVQCMSKALKVDALIANGSTPLMAKATLTRARDLMTAQAFRMKWAVAEMDQLIEMEM
jgi:hypothetical protein